MSWQDLERKPEPASPADDEWARLHVTVFGSGPGVQLLERYHRMIVDTVPAATAPESVVRDHEGQRRLLRAMEQMLERGRALAQAKAKS